MFCPECGSEYREGVARCEGCDVDLVDAPPEHVDPKLTPVLKTSNQTLLTAFQMALTAASIPHFARGAEAASLMPINATVVVPKDYEEAARELLREAEETHAPSDENDDPSPV